MDTLRIIESRPKSGVYLQHVRGRAQHRGHGVFTETDTPLSEDDVVQSVELRSVLESEAMRLACLRRTPADLERLKQILEASAAAIGRGETLADLDAEFHKAIVAATQNHVLLRFINALLISRKRREIYFQAKQQSQRSHAQHLPALPCDRRARRGSRAERLRRHIKGVDAYFRMFFADAHGRSGLRRRPRPRRVPPRLRARPPAGPKEGAANVAVQGSLAKAK